MLRPHRLESAKTHRASNAGAVNVARDFGDLEDSSDDAAKALTGDEPGRNGVGVEVEGGHLPLTPSKGQEGAKHSSRGEDGVRQDERESDGAPIRQPLAVLLPLTHQVEMPEHYLSNAEDSHGD